jgi:hypothetical protein
VFESKTQTLRGRRGKKSLAIERLVGLSPTEGPYGQKAGASSAAFALDGRSPAFWPNATAGGEAGQPSRVAAFRTFAVASGFLGAGSPGPTPNGRTQAGALPCLFSRRVAEAKTGRRRHRCVYRWYNPHKFTIEEYRQL